MILFPVLRSGTIVKSSSNLRRPTALRVAENIYSDAPIFAGAIVGVFAEYGATHLPSASTEADIPSVRVWPTIVVDLPILRVSFQNSTFQARSCITVCVDDRQSKCWTRINSEDHECNSADLLRLFSTLEDIAEKINSRLIEIYQKSISKISKRPVKLSRDYDIVVRTISDDDDTVSKYFNSEFIPNSKSSISVKELSAIQSMVSLLDSPAAVKRAGQNPESKAEIGFSSLRQSIGENGELFSDVIEAIYRIRWNKRRAIFSGVGHEPRPNSVSVKSSASYIASANVAIEYGSLF